MTPQVQEIFLRVGIENKISQNLIKATLYGSAKDFLVEEVFPDYRCSVGGGGSEIQPSFLKEYIHATLVKEGISTFDSCQTLCEENNIPVGEISYCGLKDTLGLTAQRICIPNKRKLKKTKFDKFFLKDFRESGKRLKVRGHKGNHFVVRATNVKESPASSEKLLNGFGAEIKRGLPNFYGLQRFGLRQE
jgi:TruD family tRNA pseudouridine synthase